MIKLGVSGALGRMGLSIVRLASKDTRFLLAKAMEVPGHANIGKPLRELAGLEGVTIALVADGEMQFEGLDVLIDFTNPASTLTHLAWAGKAQVAAVIGTTGLSKEDLAKAEGYSAKIPVLIAPNMSIGANLLFELASRASLTLDERYDAEIVEEHHRMKKDAPSGTALKIAQEIAKARSLNLEDNACYGRKGLTGERPKKEIGIHSVRAGEIIGTHTVIYSGPGETLELVHRAQSRDAFAQGALEAAHFLSRKKNGLYSMKDVIQGERKR